MSGDVNGELWAPLEVPGKSTTGFFWGEKKGVEKGAELKHRIFELPESLTNQGLHYNYKTDHQENFHELTEINRIY